MKYLISIILCLFLAIHGKAQQFEIERVECLPFDLTASKYVRTDLNGEPCALVKVELASPNARFQGNTIGETDYHTSEYSVYMMSGSKELRILHDSMLPLHIYFQDYGIAELLSKITYVVTLRFPEGTAASSPVSKIHTPYIYSFHDPASDYWGFKNVIGENVIAPKYEDVQIIDDDLIFVKQFGKWGIIDSKGRQRLTVNADEESFIEVSDSLFLYSKDGLYGGVNLRGEEILPFEYDRIDLFGGICWSGGGWETIYQTDNPHRGCRFAASKNGKYALYDATTCRPLTEHIYDDMTCVDWIYSGDLYHIKNPAPSKLISVKRNGKYGFINADGKEVIAPQFEDTGDYRNQIFVNGRAIVKRDGLFGVIDEEGNAIVPFKFQAIGYKFDFDRHEVFTTYQLNEHSSVELYNYSGKHIGDFPLAWISEIYGNIIVGQTFDYDKAAFNWRTGKMIASTATFQDVIWCSGNVVRVKRGNLWGCVNSNGAEVVPCSFEDIHHKANHGCIGVKENGKWGLYSLNGYFILEPKFDMISLLGADRLCAVNGGLYGKIDFYNIKGIKVAGGYDDTGDLFVQSDFIARPVRRSGLWGYISPNGQEIVECVYTDKDLALAALHSYMEQHGITIEKGPHLHKYGI